ncbi:MAG TPA: hypothetical protein VEC60_06680 [Reyranella sp.]|nr:hypothetical protein [Reyranella sp.]
MPIPPDSAPSDERLAPAIIAACTLQGLFLAALAWDLASEPIYLPSAGPLSLQFLIELVTALPCGLSALWLIGVWRTRRPPVHPLVLAGDIVAGFAIAAYLGTGLWVWIGAPLGRLQMFVAYLAAVPALCGLVWLGLRMAGGEGQRLGLRNAAQAAAKRSPQV